MLVGKKQRLKKKRFDHIEKLYNSFTVKDMTLEEFRRAYAEETSPVKARRELSQMVGSLDKQRTQGLVAAYQKKEIDARLAKES